jgi:hypothetical protein
MTVTIVLGKATDGYLRTTRSTNAAAQTGPADTVNGGNVGYVGQAKSGSNYSQYQTFIGFDYTPPAATELVTSAEIHGTTASVTSTSIARTLEIWGYGWSGGGLTVNDWRTPSQISAMTLYGRLRDFHLTNGQRWTAGQEDLTSVVPTVSSFEFLLTEYRQRNNFPPTGDEAMGIYMADQSGTAQDPALIFTSVTYSNLIPALGASVQLSNGDWVYANTSADSNRSVSLYRVPNAGGVGSASLIGAIPRGTTSDTFAAPPGAQGIALAVDSSDNLYVVGRRGFSQNMLAACCFVKQPNGTYVRSAVVAGSLASYDSMINGVAVAWHSHAGGTLVALVGHSAGSGAPSTHENFGNDLVLAVLDCAVIKSGSGDPVHSTFTADGYLMDSTVYSPLSGAYAGVPTNDTGTMMDVVWAGPSLPAEGYVVTANKRAILGGNAPVSVARYKLDGIGTGINDTTTTLSQGYGTKDAGAKVRILRINSNTVAVVSADAGASFGMSVNVLRFSGDSVTDLGYVRLGTSLITNIPGEPALAVNNYWDAVYNSVDNRVWIYYPDVNSPHVLRRTAVDLTSYKALANSVVVNTLSAGQNIQSVRVPRNNPVTDRTLVNIGYIQSGTPNSFTVLDKFNLPPTQPKLTPVGNYDATASQLYVWTFNDPNLAAGDAQSAYQLVIQDADTGVVALDTGKTVSATSSRTVAGGTLTNAKNYIWRVMTWDSSDEASPWSDWGTFSTAAGGSVTITVPVTDNLQGLETASLPISWTTSGIVQAAYRIVLRRLDTNAVVSDTGFVTSTATTATVSGMLSDVPYRVEVQARNASLVVSATGTRLLSPSFGVPEVPALSATVNPTEGYVLLSVSNPLPGQPDVNATEFGFEDGTVTGWTPTGGTIAASNVQAHTGTYSALLTTTGTPTQTYARAYALPAVVTPGQRYTVTVWAFVTVARAVVAAIDWNTPGGAYVSTTSFQVTVPANTWTKITATGTCPPTAGLCVYGPSVPGSPPAGTQLWFDDTVLTGASDKPDVVRNQILRRRAGSSDSWTIVGDAPVDGSLRDYGLTSGFAYEYKARGYSA